MKKTLLALSLLLLCVGVSAQSQMRLWQGEESTRINLTDAENIVFDNSGSIVIIAGTVYQTSEIDSLTLIHQVAIDFSEGNATFNIPAAVDADIKVEANGAHVTVTNTNVSNEVEFVLSGTSTDGSFTYNGSYKTSIRLKGLNLTSKRGAALDIQCGKRIALILEDGTENTLIDNAQGEQKACLYCKGHMEVEGSGTLKVTGNLTHAIKTKEYLQLKKSTGTIIIDKAAGDAIHVGQYYQQSGGTVNITSTTQGDGIQVEILTLDDDVTPDPDKEFNGQAFIKGGTLNIDVTHEDCEALKADNFITVSGGTFVINATGNGSRGLQTDGSMIIGEEDNATNMTIMATGGLCTNEDHEDDPHRCMGIKVDGDLTINAGTITVKATGSKGRSIKVGGTYTKNGGSVSVSPGIKN